MALHNKQGLEVAKLELLYGRDPQIKEIADLMINKHKIQIKQLIEAKENLSDNTYGPLYFYLIIFYPTLD